MKNKNNHSKTPPYSQQLRGRLLQFLMMCKLLQMFAHLASNTCMNLKREGEKSTLHIQRRSSSQQHLLNRAPRCLTLLLMTWGRITMGLFMHGMNKMCLVDAGCCSSLHWKNMSNCTINGPVEDCEWVCAEGLLFFVCQCYTCIITKREKGSSLRTKSNPNIQLKRMTLC